MKSKIVTSMFLASGWQPPRRSRGGWPFFLPLRLPAFTRFLLLFLPFAFCLLPCSHAQYADGNGSPEFPYEITEPNQLIYMSQHPEHWDQHFILTADLNMNLADPNTFTTALIAPDTSTSYGFQGTAFSGIFNGTGYSIWNLKIISSGADYIGLFGNINSGEVNNLCLENVTISADEYIGGLVGLNSGEIINCHATGNISGNDDTGGICGQNNGTLVNCAYLGGTVSGGHTTGGLVARSNGNIAYSYATCTVNGNTCVGGLTGIAWGLVEQCFADCIVSGERNVGGLSGAAGEVSIVLLNCYAFGRVEGSDSTGGFVGHIHGATPVAVNCYSAAQVIPPIDCDGDPWCRVGGFVGTIEFFPEPLGCFWDTEASGLSDGVASQDPDPSGVVGLTTEQMKQKVNFVGWNCDGAWTFQNGIDYPHLVWEGQPGELLPEETYSGGSGTPEAPYLISTAQQLNTINNYYCHLSRSFKLIADIDMSELAEGEFQPIGSTMPFTGIFDGNGHSISNLRCVNTEDNRGNVTVGLFDTVGGGYDNNVTTKIYNLSLIDPDIVQAGTDTFCTSGTLAGVVTYRSQISNITIINACLSISTTDAKGGGVVGVNSGVLSDITCSGSVEASVSSGGIASSNGGQLIRCEFSGQVVGGNCTGGLAGRNTGTVDQCSSNGSVEGQHNNPGLVNGGIGGIVGECYYGSIITDSYSQCDVTGDNEVGGFCGYVYNSTISNCYSSGIVTGIESTGGFVGYYFSQYHPSTYVGCLWDADRNPGLTSFGYNNASGVTSETTENLQFQSSFVNWDFVGEEDNGTDNIWRMCVDGIEYPKLYWQFHSADFTCPDGVEIYDLWYLTTQWLSEGDTLRCDIAPSLDGDGIVNLFDYHKFSEYWLNESSP